MITKCNNGSMVPAIGKDLKARVFFVQDIHVPVVIANFENRINEKLIFNVVQVKKYKSNCELVLVISLTL